jgi:anti-sigma factor RsiW
MECGYSHQGIGENLEDKAQKEEALSRYLLGELSEQEREQVEERYFEDGKFFESLLVAEDELIDDYVRGALTDADRARFERHYLRAPERRERVEFAASLLKYASESRHKATAPAVAPKRASRLESLAAWLNIKRPAMIVPLAAAVLLLLGGAWVVTENARLKSELEQARSERAEYERMAESLRQQADEQRSRNDQLALEAARRDEPEPPSSGPVTPQRSGAGVAVFALSPGLVRGEGEARKLVITPSIQTVKLRADLRESDYPSYRAALRTVEGKQVLNRSGLKPTSEGTLKKVVVTVPARQLEDEDYILTLSGVAVGGAVEDVGEYSFSVVRK